MSAEHLHDSSELRALVWRLTQLHESALKILAVFVADDIYNGCRCFHCDVTAMGTFEPHKPDCPALLLVAALKDRSWVKTLLGSGSVEDGA